MDVAHGQMGIHVRKKIMSEKNFLVMGLDPGRDKIGFAFVKTDGTLIASGIFSASESKKFFDAMSSDSSRLSEWLIEGNSEALPENLVSSVKFIAIGNGTHSKKFTEHVRENLPCEILSVDEKNTTLEARNLYWKIHAPSFLIRLIPEGLRVPERVLDDLAAWSIALRGLKKYRDITQNKL